MSKKRQDHVFNHSLKKTLEGLAELVQELLDLALRDRDIHGAKERSDRLRGVLATIRKGLSDNPAFDLVVDKGSGEEEGDLNSRLHGNAKQQMEFAFRQFLQSQSRWELAGHRDMESASRFLHTSCLHLRLAIVQWIDTAVDAEAEKLVSKDAKAGALVKSGREYLMKVRDELVALLRYYQP